MFHAVFDGLFAARKRGSRFSFLKMLRKGKTIFGQRQCAGYGRKWKTSLPVRGVSARTGGLCLYVHGKLVVFAPSPLIGGIRTPNLFSTLRRSRVTEFQQQN